MEVELDKIRKLSKQRENENWEFRSFLKSCDMQPEKIDSIVNGLYKKISSQIDCKTCANCCKEMQPELENEDITNLAKGLGITSAQLKEQYLAIDRESGEYIFNKKPCPFLRSNLCSCYPYRPEACASYPHLNKPDFIFRLINVIGNYSVCPIVFNTYEHLKDELWHHRRQMT